MILYYSNRCAKCKQLFETQNLDNMKKVCVDNQQFPAYVKSVPTLVVDNKDMYTGSKVIQYLQENTNLEPYEFGFKNGGFSFIDDDSCKYTMQRNYSEIN